MEYFSSIKNKIMKVVDSVWNQKKNYYEWDHSDTKTQALYTFFYMCMLDFEHLKYVFQ